MYACRNCGCNYEEPKFLNGNGYMPDEYVCPACGEAWDDEEAKNCDLCQEYKHPDNMITKHCCKDCAEKYNTLENQIRFLKETNLESEFFVEYLFCSDVKKASDALIFLCRGAWEAMGEYGKNELKNYIKEVKEDFAEWLECL